MENTLGMLNQVKQTIGADEAYLVTNFEVVKNDIELQVTVRDGGVPAEPERYFVTILKDGEVLAESGPEQQLADATRNAYSKANSRL